MKIALYAGSFDPITNGHIDIITRASKVFDKVIIAIANNSNKRAFLSSEIRKMLIQQSLVELDNIEVQAYDGLTYKYAKSVGATVLIRGIRNSADLEYELQLERFNEKLSEGLTTVYFTSKPEHNYISSSAIREIINYKGKISDFVPPKVEEYILEHFYK